jgi:hypothetical protein
VVDCWRYQTAGTPILDRVRPPGVVCATGTPAGVSGVEGIVVLVLSSRDGHTLLEYVFIDRAFTYCRPGDAVSRDHESLRFSNDLVTWVDGPLLKDGSKSALLRPIPPHK